MRLPSIAQRLSWTLLVVALATSLAASAAVWLAVRHEVRELQDDTLQGAAEAMLPHLAQLGEDGPLARSPLQASGRYAWQVVAPGDDGRSVLLQASSEAPRTPLCLQPCTGLVDRDGWRVFATPVGDGARMLYVAQTHDEQLEALLEVVLAAALATLAIGLLSHLALRLRVQAELLPLMRLSERLLAHDLMSPGASLGAAERTELRPVHLAIDRLSGQLARRLAQERAFAAHAAHALRTPLAGMDAQLAVAVREAPAELRPRLVRVRLAASRLQQVVAALLALFRSGVELQREALALPALLSRLPVQGLEVVVAPEAVVLADADLLSAALMNLLDNALRHGARTVRVALAAPGVVEVADDGPGVDAAAQARLRNSLDSGDEPGTGGSGLGLGLALADLIARAHGGRLELVDSERGFVVRLNLNEKDTPA